MSLNNRVHSRDYQSAERSGHLVSNRVTSTVATSIQFASTQAGSGLQAPTEDSLQLFTYNTQTVGLESGKGNDTSIEWSVVSTHSRYSCSSLFLHDSIHILVSLNER